MPTKNRFHTPEYRYKGSYLSGWIEVQTHPRWNSYRVRYDIGTLDNYAETSNAIRDAQPPDFLDVIRRYNIDPPDWRWLPNTRWSVCHIKLGRYQRFMAEFIPYWEAIIDKAMATVPGVERVAK